MRVTHTLLRQNIGWHFTKHWQVQGRRKIIETGAAKELQEQGIQIEDPNEFLKEKRVFEKVEVIGFKDSLPKLDKTHPNWHDRPLLSLRDNNVLLEGLTQARILTNTIQTQEGLPDKYKPVEVSKDIHRKLKRIILGAHILDAEQEKLPKIKDPERPAFNFPRIYGVTQNRVFKLLVSKLLNLIETKSNPDLIRERYLADNLLFSFPFERDGDLIQFQSLGDVVLLSEKPLGPISNENMDGFELPDIYPIKPTVTLREEHIYLAQDVFPVKKGVGKYNPHTLFMNYDRENVKNLYEEPVTEQQIWGNSLLKTFTAAASYARAQYGANVQKLPNPVTLQSIQTDGQRFYFGVLQLNTLNLESSECRNVWYQCPVVSLFEKCAYEQGKPVVTKYNRNVLSQLLSFYNNV